MNHARIDVSIASELSQVRFVGAAVRAILLQMECTPEQIEAVELCVVEAINNVIEHAYRAAGEHVVQLRLELHHDLLELSVRDAGVAMPDGTLERAQAAHLARDAAAAAALESLAEGGYGLGLILELMDQVRYRREGSQNILSMSLRLVRGGAGFSPANSDSTHDGAASLSD